MAAPLPPTFSNRSLRVLSGNEDDLRAAAAAAEAANEAAEENGGAGGSQEAGTTASLTEGAAPPRRVGFVGVPDPEPAAERSDLDDDICELCLERGHSKEECKFYVQRRRARSKSLARVRQHSVAKVKSRRHRERSKSRQICYQCKEMGHWKADCPQNPDNAGKRPKLKASGWGTLAQLREQAGHFNKPLPANVDITIPGITKAWEWFQRVDEDESGRLDLPEVAELARQLGVNWSKRQLASAYEDMTTANGFYTTTRAGTDAQDEEAASNGQGASFHDFAQWWARHTAVERREMRRTIKELFEQGDTDRSGVIDKQVRKTHLLRRHLILKTTVLLRQARYKHRESTQNREMRFVIRSLRRWWTRCGGTARCRRSTTIWTSEWRGWRSQRCPFTAHPLPPMSMRARSWASTFTVSRTGGSTWLEYATRTCRYCRSIWSRRWRRR
jgi:Ca2+-binding EF-hand superfamily protein